MAECSGEQSEALSDFPIALSENGLNVADFWPTKGNPSPVLRMIGFGAETPEHGGKKGLCPSCP